MIKGGLFIYNPTSKDSHLFVKIQYARYGSWCYTTNF